VRRILICLFVLVGLGIAAILVLAPSSWEEKGAKLSPDGNTKIFEYYYMSDGNRHAPYGTYLFIGPANGILPATSRHVVYAGYCDGLSYEWVSYELIEISLGECEGKYIRTLARNAYGVEFVLK